MSERIFAMIKGESGSGKSIQANSFPEVYNFDFDHRLQAVKRFFAKRDPDKKIHGRSFQIDEYPAAYQILEGWAERGKCPYQTINFDTSTTIIDAILYYVNYAKGQTTSKAKGAEGDSGFGMALKLGILSLPPLDDFRWLIKGFTDLLALARQIENTHVILCCHIQQVTEKKGKTSVSRSVLANQGLAQKLPVSFDEIYHMDVETGLVPTAPTKRIIVTEHSGEDFARTSLNLPPRIDVTDKLLYQHIISYHPEFEVVQGQVTEVKQGMLPPAPFKLG
jgi:hypothetical protein